MTNLIAFNPNIFGQLHFSFICTFIQANPSTFLTNSIAEIFWPGTVFPHFQFFIIIFVLSQNNEGANLNWYCDDSENHLLLWLRINIWILKYCKDIAARWLKAQLTVSTNFVIAFPWKDPYMHHLVGIKLGSYAPFGEQLEKFHCRTLKSP